MSLTLTRFESIDLTTIIPTTVSFMSVVPSTSGRLHSEFVRLLFLPLFCSFRSSACATRPWTLPLPSHGFLFTVQKQGSESLRIILNIDGSPITSKSHSHPSHSQTSHLLTSSSFRIRFFLWLRFIVS